MVARGGRAAPPVTTTDRLTSIHIPTTRHSSRPRSSGGSPNKRQAMKHQPPQTSSPVRSRYLSPPKTRTRQHQTTTSPNPRTYSPRQHYSNSKNNNNNNNNVEYRERHDQREHRETRHVGRDEPPAVIGDHPRSSPLRHRPSEQEAYGEATCDYDNGATILYELLESSNWEKARSRCRSHPSEVRTWIVRKDRSLQVRWKLLPLHAAIIFQSPNFIVSALLEKYPAAASRKDDQGMLPLHLAFRHKQEDEDLLELLLVQYPKAVMVKDRRDRVPLEHGRDSKFSAKLMRLYADATVAGSRAMSGHYPPQANNNNNNNNKQNSAPDSPTRTTVASTQQQTLQYEHQIARLEAEHEGRIAILKAELNAENEDKVAQLQEKYENEIQRLKDTHDEKIVNLVADNRKNMEDVRMDAHEERQKIIEQHKGEMDELRDLLTSQVRKDRMMRDALETEVTGLHADLSEVRQANKYEHSKYNQMKSHVEEVNQLLSKVCEDQIYLQELVAQQQEELQNAHSVRQGLLQTLLENESTEGENCRLRVSRMAEITSKLKHKIERTLERQEEFSESSLVGKDELSRIERERSEKDEEEEQEMSGRDASYRLEEARERVEYAEESPDMERDDQRYLAERSREYDVDQGHGVTSEDAYQAERAHQVAISPAYRVEEGIEITSEGVNQDVYRAPPQKDKSYEGRILADDISAITDNTEF